MSENRMNNITMAVNLNLSQALDMTYIYGRVSAMCMMFDLRCPVILTNQRLPIGINSIWIRSKNDLFRMIVVSDRLDEEKTMELIMSEIANKTHKYVQVVDERFGLYTDVSDIHFMDLIRKQYIRTLSDEVIKILKESLYSII